jgi:hypothetical protein
MVLEPTWSPFQLMLCGSSVGIKLQESEADHSPPSSAEVKNDGALPLPPLMG